MTQLTGIIPLQNYQVFIYGIAGLGPIMVLIMIGVWGTWVIVAVFAMSPWLDRIGRRKSLFLAYAFIIPGGLVTVITWARFEARESTDIALGSGIIVGMFILVFGYGGVLNTFAPTVSNAWHSSANSLDADRSSTVLVRDYAYLHSRCRCLLRKSDRAIVVSGLC